MMLNVHRYFTPLIAATILAAPTVASALSFNTNITGSVHGLNPTMDVQLPGCSYQYVNSAPIGSCQFSDSTPGFSETSGTAFGLIDDRGMHAAATELVSISFPAGYRIVVDSSAEVSFADFLQVLPAGAPVAGYLSLTLTAHGVLGFGGSAQSYLDINNGSCHVTNVGQCTVTQLVNFADTIQIDGDLATFAEAVVGGQNGVCCVFGSRSSSSADFVNTATISNIAFTDVNGNPLNLSYTTGSGYLYAVAPVPEPSPWVLLTAAIAAVGALSKRRKSGRASSNLI